MCCRRPDGPTDMPNGVSSPGAGTSEPQRQPDRAGDAHATVPDDPGILPGPLARTRAWADEPAPSRRPNIVYILADDLGYGDVRCLNPDGQDRHAQHRPARRRGDGFTDAHSGSAVCTPTRYGILTGRYTWRSRLKTGVLGGYSPAPDRARPADRARAAQAARLPHRLHRQVAPRHGLAAEGRQRLRRRDRPRRLEGRLRPADRRTARTPSASTITSASAPRSTCRLTSSSSDDAPPGLPTVEKTWVRKGPAPRGLRGRRRAAGALRDGASFHRRACRRRREGRAVLPLPGADRAAHADRADAPTGRARAASTPTPTSSCRSTRAVGEVLDALDGPAWPTTRW